ncbi:hypothetical protein TWF192_004296 [Orbilia oligospora]|nr:hypothetical protein TWF192_004296 [Orbilia oligospora]
MNNNEFKEFLASLGVHSVGRLQELRDSESSSPSSSSSESESDPQEITTIDGSEGMIPIYPVHANPGGSPHSPEPNSVGDVYFITPNPDTCLLVTSVTRMRVKIWIHKSSVMHTSPVLANYCTSSSFVGTVKHSPTSEPINYVSIIWYHIDALVLLLKVLNHVPTAFPKPEDLSFETFWQLCATMEYFQVNLLPWFDVYYRHFKEKMMEDGYEGWLIAGKVFGDKEGYAKLVARIILEFKGWEWTGTKRVILEGPRRVGPDEEKVELWEMWGPDPIFEHMRKEHARLKTSITGLITTWHAYMVHLRTSRKFTCTCSPTGDCVMAAKELSSTLKQQGLIPSKHHSGDDEERSLVSLRLLFQSLEIRLQRGILGGMASNSDCHVYEGMAKLVRDIDGVLEGVRGADFEGGEEKFGIREICRKEMVLPWTMGQIYVLMPET